VSVNACEEVAGAENVLHLQIYSGTDLALFNALFTYIANQGWVDRDFIAASTFADGIAVPGPLTGSTPGTTKTAQRSQARLRAKSRQVLQQNRPDADLPQHRGECRSVAGDVPRVDRAGSRP
jgi:anaerobic selenocysteine-containing dehydrogenase